ncbi:MAG: hypothetical protein QOD77_595 [Thermoplasmata archaeon]|nr:hypothetical protein [Thermoplasmata archaeon]
MLGLAALLLLAAPASAAPADMAGSAALPFQFTGDHRAQGSGEYLVTGNAGLLEMELLGDGGTAMRVQHRAFGLDSSDPEAQVLWHQRVDRLPLPLAGAKVALAGRDPAFQLLATGTGDLAATTGDLLLGTLAQDRVVDAEAVPPVSLTLSDGTPAFSQAIPAGRFAARSAAGTLTLDGALQLFVSGATLRYTAPDGSVLDIPAGFRTERRQGSVYNPLDGTWMGPGSHDEYIQEYLVVEGAGRLVARHAHQAATFHLAAPQMQVTGTATLPAMQGTVTVHDAEGDVVHTLAGQRLELEGRVTLRATEAAGDRADVRGSGDVVRVAYGAVAAAYDWTTAITAVGIGAVVLAALGWVAVQGKALLGLGGAGGLVAGYARVAGDDVLEHAGRSEVYERVKAYPGVSFVQLQEALGMGASTLNYHLRVLEKNTYITPVRDGRYLRFFDRRSGHYSQNRKFAVSALRNPTTAAMARHIREHPGVSQSDLAQAFEVTPSTVCWHMARLAGAGLVQKQRDAQRTRYFVGEGWAQLPADEQARQAVQVPVLA